MKLVEWPFKVSLTLEHTTWSSIDGRSLFSDQLTQSGWFNPSLNFWSISTVAGAFSSRERSSTAARRGSGRDIHPSHPECVVERRRRRRRRGVWMDGTDWLTGWLAGWLCGGKVITPNRRQLALLDFSTPISDELTAQQISYCESVEGGGEVDLSEWPVPAETTKVGAIRSQQKTEGEEAFICTQTQQSGAQGSFIFTVRQYPVLWSPVTAFLSVTRLVLLCCIFNHTLLFLVL